MMVKDLVSVIIPACNAASFIRSAVESVLSQDHSMVELIVVDDGSNDDTASIAESFGPPLICYRQENGGPPAARNRGLAIARGEYIGFLDADDLYEPGRIAFQIGKLRQNLSVDVVIGRLMREKLASAPGEPMTFEPLETEDRVSLQLGACLFRRSVFERIGLMEKSLRHSDDWDWFMRARELGVSMLLHDDIVLRQRLHLNNMTRDRTANLRFLPIMLKRSLDRRRAADRQAHNLPSLASFHERAHKKDGGE